jgi:ligand-binding sensor domain-containing protein/signal transduction histidine kinase
VETIRNLRSLCLPLALFLSSAVLLASTPPKVQYTRSLWKVQDGLPEATVQALVETQDGYLWVGTTGGLTRFDGTHFTPYGSNLLSTPAVNSIFCLAPSPDGSLWIGTEGGGLLHLQKNSVKTYTAPNGLTDGFVRAVLVDRHETVWVGTDSGLFQVDGSNVKRVEIPGETGPLAVHGMAEDREGRIWVGGSRLLSIENGRTHAYNLPGSYSSNRVKTILQTSDGTIWVGTVGGLERLVNGKFQRVSAINSTVRTLKQTSDGTLWIGTIGGGLWTYKDASFSRLDGLLPSNTVLVVLEDDTHQIWIGLQDGLVRLSRTPVQVVPLPGGSDADFETIAGDGGNRIWAVASQVYRIVDGVAHPFLFNELPNVKVRNVFRDREGSLWVGTDGSGAYRIRPNAVVHYSAPQELTNNFIRAFLETRHGDIWVATDEGVNRITAEGVQRFGMKNGLVYFSTRSLLEDSAGDIWIGTDQGLSHWRSDRFVQDAATEALQREKVWSIYQDTRGTLWFGTRDHGIFLYQGGAVTHLTTLDGLVSNSVYQILEDPQKRFWLSGPDSISSLDEEQVHRIDSGEKPHLSVSTYAMPYGAEDAQMYGGREPSGYVDPDGGVWFPSSKGAVHVVLTDRSIPPPPHLVIEKVTLDGRELPLGGTIHVPSHMTRLEFQFAPLSLRSQTGIRYRYKLENFDKGWVYAGTTLAASYTNLPGGNYTFLVNAFDVGDPSVVSAVHIDFRKDPYLWQKWWFLTLCVVALSLLVWGTYKARIHQVRLRFKAVLDERSRLAREMHDTVIQGCTSVSALLEAIASTQSEAISPQDDLLRYARAQVRTTINEARNTVWNLRHEDVSMLNLADSLQAIATQTRQESGVPVECVVEGDSAPIAGFIMRELLMVVREAVYNAVRHGLPERVKISATFEPSRLLLSVNDNGIGFYLGDAPVDGHYGITGMRERLQRVGGSLTIASKPGVGTEVVLSVARSLLNPIPENDAQLLAHPNAELRPGKRWGRGR